MGSQRRANRNNLTLELYSAVECILASFVRVRVVCEFVCFQMCELLEQLVSRFRERFASEFATGSSTLNRLLQLQPSGPTTRAPVASPTAELIDASASALSSSDEPNNPPPTVANAVAVVAPNGEADAGASNASFDPTATIGELTAAELELFAEPADRVSAASVANASPLGT